MENSEIARILDDIAAVLEIQEANPFRIRSYRSAAQTVRGLGEDLSQVAARGELEDLPHVGESIAATIRHLLEAGELDPDHREILESPEAGIVELTRVPGVGPKHARKLWEELAVESVDDLEEAAREERVRELEGFGEKSEAKLLEGIRQIRGHQGRFLLSEAREYADRLTGLLEAVDGVDRVEVGGSLRRWKETIGDVDLLVVCDEPGPVMDAFVDYGSVVQVLGRGDTRSSVVLRNGMQADLRVVPERSYGAALVYFTGSKEHNIALRKRAVRRGLRINEYGVFRAPEQDEPENGEDNRRDPREDNEQDPGEDSGRDPGEDGGEAAGSGAADDGEWLCGRTEEEVYEAVDLPWISPELREDQGEIDAAEAGELPDLVELDDLRGDLQMHSTHSDGENSIEEMARAAADLGHEYILMTDHSKRVTMANGLDEARLRAQWEEIDEINRGLGGIRVLKGVEVDILKDGSLDLEDDCLAAADLVVASVHYDTEMDRGEMTRRVVRALENPHVDILAHPTGRRLLEREPYEIDLEAVVEAASRHGVMLECNASPERLDLGASQLRLARERDVPVVISTDAHRTTTLGNLRYGVYTARRGWLEADHVANTRPLAELLELVGG